MNIPTRAIITRSAEKLKDTGFFHIFGSNTINQIVGFAYGILIVHVISKPDFGIYSYTNSIYALLLLASGFGMSSAIMQLSSESSQDALRSDAIFRYGYVFAFRFNIGLCLAVFTVGLTVRLQIPESNALLMLMCLLPLTHIAIDMQKIWLRVNLKNKEFAAINTMGTVLISTGTVLGAWTLNVRGIVLAQYLVALTLIVILLKKMHTPLIVRNADISKTDKKDLLKIAGISTINNGLGELISLLGTIMLGGVLADESIIASYKVGSTIPNALIFVPVSLMLYLYPYFARNKDNGAWVRGKYKQIMLFAGGGNLVIALGGIALAVPIIRIMFGEQYLDAVAPFRILMFSYFISGTFRIISGNLLVTQRRLVFNLVLGVTGTLVSIACNVILIPKWGSVGAAWAQMITMTVTGAISTFYFAMVIKRI